VRILAAIAQTNRRFFSTLDEAQVRQGLAEAISDLTGTAAAVMDVDGALAHRTASAEHWRGAMEAELADLAVDAMTQPGGRTLTLGRFRARSAAMNERAFGAAVWMRPEGRPAYVIEVDQYVGMLIELASSAIIRCRQARLRAHAALAPDLGVEGL
jgi:hypothetical protein